MKLTNALSNARYAPDPIEEDEVPQRFYDELTQVIVQGDWSFDRN